MKASTDGKDIKDDQPSSDVKIEEKEIEEVKKKPEKKIKVKKKSSKKKQEFF